MDTVVTVTGPVDASTLGVTLMHEHLLLDLRKDAWVKNNLLNDPELAELELRYFVEAGGTTIVDQTNHGLGQQPLAVKRLAERTGVRIVLGCGWYREPYYAPELERTRTDAIAERMVADITDGIDDTGVRAGIIGEIGSHFTWISPMAERMFRAAARAHHRTGLTIATHVSEGSLGLEQLDLLAEEKVDLRRVIVGHAHTQPDHAYHAALARRGAFVSFDRLGDSTPYVLERNVRLVRSMIEAGFGGQILLSHDVCYRSDYVTFGGTGYAFVPRRWPELLRTAGVHQDDIDEILVDNPRRALTGAP